MYGLYPRKGTIAIGSDADLVLWDPQAERTIANRDLHHAVDYTPYEGIHVKGWPVLTLSRGEVVARESDMLARPGRGIFLPCDPPGPATLRAFAGSSATDRQTA
jgi:dihydropyrimidinase